jgi:hypothetical protein
VDEFQGVCDGHDVWATTTSKLLDVIQDKGGVGANQALLTVAELRGQVNVHLSQIVADERFRRWTRRGSALAEAPGRFHILALGAGRGALPKFPYDL